jgi:hypothetical protein
MKPRFIATVVPHTLLRALVPLLGTDSMKGTLNRIDAVLIEITITRRNMGGFTLCPTRIKCFGVILSSSLIYFSVA